MDFKKYLIVGVLSAGILTGCGGSGGSATSYGASYSGVTSAAEISEDNKDNLAESTIAVSKVITSGANDFDTPSLPFGVSVSQSKLSNSELTNLTNKLIQLLPSSELPIGASESVSLDGDCGGSMTASGSDTKVTVKFNDYCEFDIITNGSMTVTISGDNYKVVYSNLTIDDGTDSYTLNGTMSISQTATQQVTTANAEMIQDGKSISISFTMTCNGAVNEFDYFEVSGECAFSESFTADNGVTYRLDGLDSNNGFGGSWDFSATMFDPDNGYVSFDAVDLTLCTDDSGNFESGTITVTDESSNTLIITFNSCTDPATVMLNGVTTNSEAAAI